jgi:peptide-methionine (S)-S-oxide reductase
MHLYKKIKNNKLKHVPLGGGCYWCLKALYENINRLKSVISGSSGDKIINPSYEYVCLSKKEAAEVAQITYCKTMTSLDEISKVFFTVHNPTTLNRQNTNVGTHYRSVIFNKNEEQKRAAQNSNFP